MKNKKGYTIIELLITVALILILFALGLKFVFGAIQRARDHGAAATLNNINSMYRMSSAFLYLDIEKQYDGTTCVKLPTNSFSSIEEKEIETHMLLAFSELKSIKYNLSDENGIENEGEVTIEYYPYEDKPQKFYRWVDGTVYRIYNNNTIKTE